MFSFIILKNTKKKKILSCPPSSKQASLHSRAVRLLPCVTEPRAGADEGSPLGNFRGVLCPSSALLHQGAVLLYIPRAV